MPMEQKVNKSFCYFFFSIKILLIIILILIFKKIIFFASFFFILDDQKLNLEGEDIIKNIYGAKDIVNWYNGHP
jgi:hypothetical protein